MNAVADSEKQIQSEEISHGLALKGFLNYKSKWKHKLEAGGPAGKKKIHSNWFVLGKKGETFAAFVWQSFGLSSSKLLWCGSGSWASSGGWVVEGEEGMPGTLRHGRLAWRFTLAHRQFKVQHLSFADLPAFTPDDTWSTHLRWQARAHTYTHTRRLWMCCVIFLTSASCCSIIEHIYQGDGHRHLRGCFTRPPPHPHYSRFCLAVKYLCKHPLSLWQMLAHTATIQTMSCYFHTHVSGNMKSHCDCTSITFASSQYRGTATLQV